MAGRGRGSAFAYTAEVLGLGRGADAIPASIVQPPPLFPPLEAQPVPLATGEDLNYMLLLKQELRGTMKESPFCIKPAKVKKDVERYSDKYQSMGADEDWVPNWDMFPDELNYEKKKPVSKRKTSSAGKSKEPRVSRKALQKADEKLKKLEEKENEEKREGTEGTKKGEEEGEDSDEAVEEDFYEEEEMEEETDYIVSYFDPGDDFLDDDDGNDDGPIY